MNDIDGLDDIFTYRWAFDAFRTKKRYGLGIELVLARRFLIGIRLGSWMFSFGQQIVWTADDAVATTQPDYAQPA